jgi:Pyruvate/2-oxoacid:ferredoxin oxidoreductase delta subunit
MIRKRRASLLKPSTRLFIKEARRTPHYSFIDFLHGYLYARWPYLYIGIATGEHPLGRRVMPWLSRLVDRVRPLTGSRMQGNAAPRAPASQDALNTKRRPTFADTYHGKVVPLDAATRLISVQQELCLSEPEQVIPYSRARDIVLKNPDHIVVLDCPCRASRQKPCKPLDVCLVIGEPFASFVAEHNPTRTRWITPAEAIEILRAEDERGHVHHAFFKDAMLNRFYAICNCCRCCCGAMQAHHNGTPMLASSGYVSHVDETLCLACGDCNMFCQFSAISLHEGRNRVDTSLCMGCGVCVSKCEQGALTLLLEPRKGNPLVIEELHAAHAT